MGVRQSSSHISCQRGCMLLPLQVDFSFLILPPESLSSILLNTGTSESTVHTINSKRNLKPPYPKQCHTHTSIRNATVLKPQCTSTQAEILALHSTGRTHSC